MTKQNSLDVLKSIMNESSLIQSYTFLEFNSYDLIQSRIDIEHELKAPFRKSLKN